MVISAGHCSSANTRNSSVCLSRPHLGTAVSQIAPPAGCSPAIGPGHGDLGGQTALPSLARKSTYWERVIVGHVLVGSAGNRGSPRPDASRTEIPMPFRASTGGGMPSRATGFRVHGQQA